ncbi:hypothetical protein lerEdw1_011691 [Lerista edwardsae]|nr:hypothetical protein lerEdw1_011691 [Lerista edwardsae]
MFAKGKGSAVPSDGQAREKLALYVYEYLLHVGAQKSAQTFLSEIRWEKNITLGEPPGFLHSWWCYGHLSLSPLFYPVYFGTFTVQLQKGEILVNTQVKQKPFMIT